MRVRKFGKIALRFSLAITLIGFFLPESDWVIPVAGENTSSWDSNSFWAYPWGVSGTHKGIDIFAPKHQAVISPTYGLVLYTDSLPRGGNVVYLLTPKWRIHYFAHLHSIETEVLSLVKTTDLLGTVGNTGNAQNRPSHLHYSIYTPFPHFWLIDNDPQGWKKMFYYDPNEELR